MTSMRSALLGGFIATMVTSFMLIMKNALGKFNEVHIPQTLSSVLGMPDHIVVGGIAFVIIGALLLSVPYAFVAPHMPVRSSLTKGLLFGLGVWLTMMLVLMPAAGAGVFAMNRSSAIVPAFDLALTLIYGLILAFVYAWDSAQSVPKSKAK